MSSVVAAVYDRRAAEPPFLRRLHLPKPASGRLALIACACVALPVRGLYNPADLQIVTVLDQDRTYTASTAQGFFRATDADHTWRPVEMPSGMWPGGRLERIGSAAQELAYYTCAEGEVYEFGPSKAGGLWLSDDGGATWRKTSLERSVMDVFLHPDGALYAVTNEHPRNLLEPSEHVVVSYDQGETWKDISPSVPGGYAIARIEADPDHPHLVCVLACYLFDPLHSKFYQATDATYVWAEIPYAKRPKLRTPNFDMFAYPMSGMANINSNVAAKLGIFFQYPFPRNGRDPDLPTYFLKPEKTAYQFRLHQPMPVKVATLFLDSGSSVQITDHPDPQTFWGMTVREKDGTVTEASPKTAELNTDYPDHAAKQAAYSNDSRNFSVQVDQQHPYERTINLRDLYDFKQPGVYRVAVFINSIYMDRKTGSMLGTQGIDLTIVP